jgi:D-serine deaminase-like pyridoxal phosphate-dependent protein
MTNINSLTTPALLLDRDRMCANIERMARRISARGSRLRPHVKTHKSRQVLADVRRLSENHGITVSTLKEAHYFFDGGERDILYTVGMTPDKVPLAAGLIQEGCELTMVTDNLAMANLLNSAAVSANIVLPILIELDVDGHRSGIVPDGPELLALARTLSAASNLDLRGVMTHAGGSYNCRSLDEIRKHAKLEVDRTMLAVNRLGEEGLECPVVSIGSTPTAAVVDDLSGITEIRPGVYTFGDLFQVGLGTMRIDDIAISILTTVIGHQPEKGWVIVDAGWMALSRDRGTASQRVDQGYGLICSLDGNVMEDVIMGSANQEHGLLMARVSAAPLDLAEFPVGSKWRVLPNHACATAGQYNHYQVISQGSVADEWSRINGW